MNECSQEREFHILEERFNNITKEIGLQKAAIYGRFNRRAQYVVLGVKSMETLQRYIHFKQGEMGEWCRTYQEFLGKYYDLVGIVDTSVFSAAPNDYVQVIVPPEVYL